MKFNIKKSHIETLLELNPNLTTDYPFLLSTVNSINKYSADQSQVALKTEDLDAVEKFLVFLKSDQQFHGLYTSVKIARDILVDPYEAKIGGNINALSEALKVIMRSLPHQLLFKKDDTADVVYPYNPTSVEITTPREGAPYVTVVMKAWAGGKYVSANETFHMSDLVKGCSAVSLLLSRNFVLENDDLYDHYVKETEWFLSLWKNHGQQYSFTSDKAILSTVEEYSNHRNIFRKGDKFVNNIENNQNTINAPKTFKSSFVKDKDVEDAVHPMVYVHSLNTYTDYWIHVGQFEVYKYDTNVINKLILHPDHRDLVDSLSETYGLNINDFVEGKSGGTIILSTGKAGVGKCHGKGTKILMFDGTVKKVEDIQVGDLLMGDDSKSRKVLSLARGTENMYRIVPKRGSDSFEINESHILTIKLSGKQYSNELMDISFNEYLLKNKSFQKNAKLIRTHVNFGDFEPELNPYFLGLWLGDGDWRHPHIHVNTTTDVEIKDFLQKYAEQLGLTITEKVKPNSGGDCVCMQIKGTTVGQYHNNSLTKMMDQYGLRKSSKMLNQELITTSINYRKQILAGYVDSDGYKCNEGTYEISSKRKELSEQILFLARSVGYTATMSNKIIKWSGRAKKENEEIQRDYCRIHISGAYDLPVLLPRKKSNKQKINKNNLVTGFSYESLGVGEYFGFSITGNRRYLLHDTTITHNTLTAEVLSEKLERPLYRLNVSQLGTEPERIEKNLQKFLSYADSWNAIALLDEADLYVMTRSSDLKHNGIVTVFLKTLEYCNGLVFLTTNRTDTIDEAVLSRCTAIIKYEYPTDIARLEIWKLMNDQYELNLDDDLIAQLNSKWKCSGRDIKMLCILVKKYCTAKNIKPTFDQFTKLSAFRGMDQI